MTVATAPADAPAVEPVFSSSYKGVVLSLLLLTYTFNFIDRTIVNTIGQAIKVDLKITDTQLGLLGGLSFAILYTLLGLPIARLAERKNRVSVIAASMVIWSAFTVACGFAGSFVQLLAMRVGVGVGEAGCSPPSHSLISDYYEPKRRATALSVYAFGIPLGGMIGAVAGGWLAKNFGWRVAFIAVGAPGVIMALILKLVVKEPPRGHSDPLGEQRVTVAAFSVGAELRELGAVAKSLFGSWPIFNMVMGVTLVSFAGYGIGQFAAPYFIRTFGLDYATVGLIFGLIGGFSAGLGTIAGGVVSDRASRWGTKWYALTPAIGVAIAAPLYYIAYTQADWRVAAAILLFPGIFGYTYLGPTFAVVQNVVETRRRATATAVLFLFLNIIALGGGPLFTGWVIDHLAQGLFHAGHFATACPGGVAPHGSPASLAARCKTALLGGTRQGILVTMIFYVWGSFHYLLASFGLSKELARVEAGRKLREA